MNKPFTFLVSNYVNNIIKTYIFNFLSVPLPDEDKRLPKFKAIK